VTPPPPPFLPPGYRSSRRLKTDERKEQGVGIAAAAADNAYDDTTVPLRSYSISLAENATSAEHFAANELAGLLGNMTNGDQPLPVITPAGEAAAAGPILAVGTVASVKAGLELSALDGLGEEGFVVSAAGLRPGCLAFAGGAGNYTRGVLFAVYHFLEVLGAWPLCKRCCDFLTRGRNTCKNGLFVKYHERDHIIRKAPMRNLTGAAGICRLPDHCVG
jgi:hypothetical protein